VVDGSKNHPVKTISRNARSANKTAMMIVGFTDAPIIGKLTIAMRNNYERVHFDGFSPIVGKTSYTV